MKAPIKDGIVYSPYPEVELNNGSFFEALKKACLNDDGKPILIDDCVTLTKTEFVSLLRRYAAGLQKHGVEPGDRVCVHIGNSVDNFVAMWSCVVAGASITLAKPSLTERELRYQITDSDSTHLLVEPALSEKARRASSELGLKGLFTTRSAEGFISMAPFADMVESDFQEVAVDNPREAILAILYTSGTTGLPKGVQITHYGFLANIGMSRWTAPWDEHDVIALPTPITHGSGLVFITISVLLGTTCVIIPPNLGLLDMATVVEQHKVTAAILLPWHLRTLVSEMQSTGIRLRGLRRVCTGGMVLSPSQYKAVQEAFGEGLEVLANVYAMTEAASLLCSPSRDHATGVDMGFPAPATMFKVVDKLSRRCLGPYKTGELLFKAPTVMKGYYKRPTETAEFFDEEGWCKSGDAGYYDEDGRLYFVQRFKEMIKCMDNQVTPAELEDLLLREHSSDIADVCIVGIPDTVYGEAPAAAVVTRCSQESMDLEELSRRIKKTITDNCAVHKHLYGGVFFVDCIPKTESGKTDRPAVLRKCC